MPLDMLSAVAVITIMKRMLDTLKSDQVNVAYDGAKGYFDSSLV
jgi:hypothetical protein